MLPTTPAAERLFAIKKHIGLSLKRIAAEANLNTAQTLYEIGKGKHSFSSDVAEKIQRRWPEISRGWLMSGEGNMLISDAPIVSATVSDNRVPLLPISAFAGPISRFLEKGVNNLDCELVIAPTSGSDLALPVSGDSMEPLLQDGSIIFVKRINERAFIPWGKTMVIDTENGAYVKDVFPGEDGCIVARSRNPKYPDLVIPMNSIFGLYRLVSSIRSYGVM